MGLCLISAKEIDTYRRRRNALLLDLREPEDYRQWHIPGARNVPVEELEMFMEAGDQHTGLTELIVKPDFPQRKAEMIRRGDVFIAFPGGTGTLEEISEIMSLAALKLTKAPCVLYNLNGYYDHLRLQLRHMVDMGLSAPERLENIHFAASLQEIKDIAASAE